MADDPVFVLVRVRAGGLDRAIGFLLEDGAFCRLERGGLDHLPSLPTGSDFAATLLEPAFERSLCFLAGFLFRRLDRIN